ncbi:MAG: cyclic nucleotide-binding domain-containing protein [Magnetococcales bacterium]|nr:cyclic nucleotide-binding domain-containing protein [Magnetococcales bacterium]
MTDQTSSGPSKGRWLQTALLPTLLTALIIGIDNVGTSLASASLLFSGALAPGLNLGIQVLLLSSMVMAIGLRSTQPNGFGVVQEMGIAILSVTLANMSNHLENVSDGARIATSLAVIGSASLATGLLMVVVGKLKLGSFARYIPFPVFAGFLAGSGWMLIEGAISLISGEHSGGLELLRHLSEWNILVHVIITILFAVGLTVVLQRFSHPMIMPAYLILSGAVFYLVVSLGGWRMDALQMNGWLPEPLAHASASSQWDWRSLHTQIVWPEVAMALPAVLSIALLNLLDTLFTLSGLELASGRELEANTELQRTGIANLLTSTFGGASGYMDFSYTQLADKMGSTTRWTGVAVAGVTAFGLVFAEPLIAVMPVFLSSGIILFMGIEIVIEWLIETRHSVPRSEWGVILLVFLVIAGAGFLYGLALGTTVAIVLFVVNYARLPVVRRVATAAQQRSNVDRSLEATRYLGQHGDTVVLLYIHGYLFFGSTVAIVDWVKNRITARNQSPLRYLILDMKRVQGADSSAMAVFSKIHNLAENSRFHVIFCSVSTQLATLFHGSGFHFESDPIFSMETDSDHALERCEERLLENAQNPSLLSAHIQHHFATIIGTHERIPDMVKVLDRLSFPHEGVLIRRGDPADCIYFLESGNVKISLTLPDGRTLRLRTMTSGAIVGDVGVCLGQTRTADVIAEGEVVVYRLDVRTFEAMEEQDSNLAILFHRLLERALAEKIVAMNEAMKALQN